MADSWWWDALVTGWYPGDEFRPSVEVQRYYAVKHQIVHDLQPSSILEIGVRAGYSAFAFLSARPGIKYLGIDNGLCDREIVRGRSLAEGGLLGHARKLLSVFPGAEILPEVDSQKLQELPARLYEGGARFAPYEFVHVYAQHTVEGCFHDLMLAQQEATWILVDDYAVPDPDVRAAVQMAFPVSMRHEWTKVAIPDGLRGSLLLLRKGRARNWLSPELQAEEV